MAAAFEEWQRSTRKSTLRGDLKGDRLQLLVQAVDEERAQLLRASNVLRCLVIALNEAPSGPNSAPYYPDVAALVSAMLDASLDRLDRASMRVNSG